MSDLDEVLTAFTGMTTCQASIWTKSEPGDAGGRLRAPRQPPPGLEAWQPPLWNGPPVRANSPAGLVLVAQVPGPEPAWLLIGPCSRTEVPLETFQRFLLPVVSQFLHSSLEVEHAANELAERYEEINLLYTITEILGRTVTLEEGTATILKEVSETVGAQQGAILVHDRATDTLQAVTALRIDPRELPPIALSDACSVSARVFRDQRAQMVEGPGECAAEAPYRSGTMLSVPLMWTAPGGRAEPLGVVNLSGRAIGQAFTAGDQKLMSAIATQIGTAIQNARLVRASLEQQRVMREIELAHDLQMKLLPRTSLVAPEAQVAARVLPAESVGGDFYNLFRLGGNQTGVMIGDVSSHGYRAALIMALAQSASAIHAQASADPAATLGALLDTLGEELLTTEMFITTFYGVIDRGHGELRYANAGHPHAFLFTEDGRVERLSALGPPLGMTDDMPTATTRPWSTGSDLLLLFTDGVSDARNLAGVRLGEERVLDVVSRYREQNVNVILDAVFSELREYTGAARQRDDMAVLIIRS
jgi:phosphoserine phosphatase RsbU/P